jgi:hypothetical protein
VCCIFLVVVIVVVVIIIIIIIIIMATSLLGFTQPACQFVQQSSLTYKAAAV